MKRIFNHLLVPGILILFLPLAGAVPAGRDWHFFLAFPPRPVSVGQAPFSPAVFGFLALFILGTVAPFVKAALDFNPSRKDRPRFPLPGWALSGGAGLVLFWILAWTRFDWFAPFQAHTFFPLWFCLITVINGLTYRRQGTCPMEHPRFYLLFPVSALFWWLFEYLNRFVGNWVYTGSEYPAVQYFFLATLSFSTVLPAVESVRAFLMSLERFEKGFRNGRPVTWVNSPVSGSMLVILCGTSLFFLPAFPDLLFPLVWISPLGIILGFLILAGRSHVLTPVKTGDFTPVAAYGAAALVCGFFWELFNLYSLARWEYRIPFVQVLPVFEMPILGYAGYLPFGLECGAVIHILQEENET